MIFHLYESKNPKKEYIFDSEIIMTEFFSLVEELAKAFKVEPIFVFAPEAEFATLLLVQGKIFTKYDLVYGLEISFVDLSGEQQSKLENVLSTR